MISSDFHRITLLRDPLKRFVSQHRESINANNSLSQFLEWEKRFLSRKDDNPKAHNGLTYNHQTQFLSGAINLPITESDLHTAKTNLINFSFVGVAEHFDRSAILFSKVFKLPYIKIAPVHKYRAKTKNIIPIDPAILDYIKKKSSHDYSLYELAMSLFIEKDAQLKNQQSISPEPLERMFAYPLRKMQLSMAKVAVKIKNKSTGTNITF